MRRRSVIVGSGMVAATALAGCLGRAQEDGGDEPSDESERTIVVSESGQVEAEPDVAILRVGVVATGDDAASVRDELARRASELEDGLVDAGVAEDDVTTVRFDVRERVDRRRLEEAEGTPDPPEAREEYTYYEGTHAYRVEIQDVDAAGSVVDAAVDAGADDVDRIEFTLSDERRETLREDALEAAIEDARAEADFVAEQIGASVVDVRVIDTSGGRVSPVRERVAFEASDGAAPATEFRPGDVTVSATVQVEYEME